MAFAGQPGQGDGRSNAQYYNQADASYEYGASCPNACYGQPVSQWENYAGQNADYFANGMRPCLYQYPAWLHMMVSASSGHVHLRLGENAPKTSACQGGADQVEISHQNLSASRNISPGSTGTGGTAGTKSMNTDGSTVYEGSEHSKGRAATPEDIDVSMAFKLLEAGGKSHLNLHEVKDAALPYAQLHNVFDPSKEVQPWNPDRFVVERDLSEAVRNQGKVSLIWDSEGKMHLAAKQMPNSWVCGSHAEFIEKYPAETEWPWQDIGCMRYLNSVNYPYGCTLHGVYKDRQKTAVMTTFASEGDLFAWCKKNTMAPGPEREALVRPLALQMFEGVRQLHELSIVHRDVSMENCLVSEESDGDARLYIIDFGMAETKRFFTKEVRGKKSYVAPECHGGEEYDAYLADAFSVGVALYCILLMEYPWQSTAGNGTCKCFDFVQKRGFLAYAQKRKLRNTNHTVEDALSKSALHLLNGLLSFDPACRLTLGESTWRPRRQSVWDEEWLQTGCN